MRKRNTKIYDNLHKSTGRFIFDWQGAKPVQEPNDAA